MVKPLWFAVLAGIALSGCAGIQESAGYNVTPKAFEGRQEPWHNLTLVGDVYATKTVSVAFVALPEPLPEEWKKEFVDTSRVYVVDLPEGKKARKPLERVVFRAILYHDEHFLEMFDAVLNPEMTGFFVLMPPNAAPYVGENLVILSSDALRLMTVRGEMVSMARGQSLKELPQGFFEDHPSRLTRVASLDRSDPTGERVFADIEDLFPRLLDVQGVRYSGRPDTQVVAAQFTKVDTVADRFISCGSMTISPGLVTVGLAVSGIRSLYAISKEDCFH